MNANINSVVVTLSNGTSKKIEVKNGMILILMGNGPMDGAFYKKLEECSDADFNAAKEVTADFTPKPWGDSLDDDVVDESYKCVFDTAVEYLAHCSGEDFLELVSYAKKHENKFFRCVKEIASVANANVAYYSAIVRLARPLGEAVERKAFKLFDAATEVATVNENVEDFLDMWKALQTISYFCG